MNGRLKQALLLWAGPVLFTVVLLGSKSFIPDYEARAMLAITLWMAVWWISECVPISATALLPLVLMPLSGVLPLGELAAAYGHKYIFLFLGGFLLALAIEKWRLHWRMALHLILLMGNSPRKVLMGFMLTTAILSMWISNTATAIMMLPMAVAVGKRYEQSQGGEGNMAGFQKALMLGIAYSASIGGMATLIGSPPNLILAGMLEKTYGIEMGFLTWLGFGLPVAVLLMAILMSLLVKTMGKVPETTASDELKLELQKLGPIDPNEWRVIGVFGLTALAWMVQSFAIKPWLPGIDDTVIAMISGIALFVIPASNQSGRLLEWREAEGLPWGVLLLFGGGIALAMGFEKTQVAANWAQQLQSLNMPHPFLVMLLVIAAINFLTEITSNLATTAVMLPVLAPFAKALGIPEVSLLLAATFAASCAFMLPVGTPPNAIVFASGKLNMRDMVKTGIWMNLLSIAVLTILAWFVFGKIPLI